MKRNRNKWKRIFLWSFIALLVIGISGLFAIDYAVNKWMESMAQSLEPETKTKLTNHANELPLDSNESVASSSPAIDSPSETNRPSKPVKQTAQGDNPGVYAPEVSTNKVEKIKEKVTISEKATVTSIVMGNLNIGDLNKFRELASGGLTSEEKREARKILLEKLTPEEYNRLVEIAKKYGVGRQTYDEAQREETDAAKTGE